MLRNPKVRMIFVLLLLSLIAIFHFFSLLLVFRFLWIIIATLIFEYFLWRIRRVKPFLPTAGVVSALIIFLLSDTNSTLYQVLFAIFVAIGGKQFIRFNKNHIFNPAALGLVVAGIFGLPITWWGVSWGYIPLILIILGAGWVSLFTIRQHLIIIPFIIVTIFASWLLIGSIDTALNQLLVGSFWFFTLVMLPEPMTAAHFTKTRIIYGMLVAILSFLIVEWLIPDPLIGALLVGNLAARFTESLGVRENGICCFNK